MVRHILTHILVLAVADQLLGLAHLIGVRHRQVAVMQRDRLYLGRPVGGVGQRGLRHQTHGIAVGIAQILRGGHGRFQQGKRIGVTVILSEILQRCLAAAGRVQLLKVVVHVLPLAGRGVHPHLLHQIIRPALQLAGQRFTLDIIVRGALHLRKLPGAPQRKSNKNHRKRQSNNDVKRADPLYPNFFHRTTNFPTRISTKLHGNTTQTPP